MPNTYIGTSKLRKCFLGTTKVKKIYLGTSLVFQDGFTFSFNGVTYEESAENSAISYTKNSDGSFKLLIKQSGTFVVGDMPSELKYDVCCVGGGASGSMGTGWQAYATNHGGAGGKGGTVSTVYNVGFASGSSYYATIGAGGAGYFREGNDDTPNPGSATYFGNVCSAAGGSGNNTDANGSYIFDAAFDSRLAGAGGGRGAHAGPGGSQGNTSGGTTGGGRGGYFDGGYSGQSASYWGSGGGGGASHWNDWDYRSSGSGYQGVVAIRGRL